MQIVEQLLGVTKAKTPRKTFGYGIFQKKGEAKVIFTTWRSYNLEIVNFT